MKRRRFIQSLAWVTGGIFLTRCTPAGLLVGKGNSLKGAVVSKGKGVENVIVSDGYTVVPTDNKGRFEIVPHPDAIAVFISTPSGFAFAHENGIARHYRLLEKVDVSKDIVFELTPLNNSDDEHQFIIWADPQVRNKSDVAKMMSESVPDVQEFVRKAGTGALLHGITVGDIAWDNLEYFNDYNAAVEKMGMPFFQCLGNHDMDYNKGGDETSDDTFQKTYGPTYYSFNRGQVHYIVMDDVRYLGKDRDYDGYIQQHQLAWLKKDLSFVTKDKLIVLCLHIPVHKGVKNNEDLYQVLEDRNVHIMSGHTHYHVNAIRNNIYEHNHGTVCGAWWTGPICEDGTPKGYGIYTVKGNQLSWQYKASGMPVDYQMKVFVDTFSNDQKQVTVNIWNYDPEWKQEYWIDGTAKGALEQYEGFDPLAYKTLLGPDLPNPRGFAEPKLTTHLFRATVPSGAKEIMVKATDRFGNVYTEKKSLVI